MNIERIYLASKPGGALREFPQVRVLAGAGIDGDRYFNAMGEPRQNISLVEAEVIEEFNATFGTRHGSVDGSRAGVWRGRRTAYRDVGWDRTTIGVGGKAKRQRAANERRMWQWPSEFRSKAQTWTGRFRRREPARWIARYHTDFTFALTIGIALLGAWPTSRGIALGPNPALDADVPHAAECADQDDRHRRIDATAQHQWLEHVVGHSRDEDQHAVDDRRDGPVVASPPNVGDGRQGDDQRGYLGNPEYQHDHRQHARKGYASEQQTKADEDRLNEGDADDALCNGPYGCRG